MCYSTYGEVMGLNLKQVLQWATLETVSDLGLQVVRGPVVCRGTLHVPTGETSFTFKDRNNFILLM